MVLIDINKFRTNEILNEDNRYRRGENELARKFILTRANDVNELRNRTPTAEISVAFQKLVNTFNSSIITTTIAESKVIGVGNTNDRDVLIKSVYILTNWNALMSFYTKNLYTEFTTVLDNNVATRINITYLMRIYGILLQFQPKRLWQDKNDYKIIEALQMLLTNLQKKLYQPINFLMPEIEGQPIIAPSGRTGNLIDLSPPDYGVDTNEGNISQIDDDDNDDEGNISQIDDDEDDDDGSEGDNPPPPIDEQNDEYQVAPQYTRDIFDEGDDDIPYVDWGQTEPQHRPAPDSSSDDDDDNYRQLPFPEPAIPQPEGEDSDDYDSKAFELENEREEQQLRQQFPSDDEEEQQQDDDEYMDLPPPRQQTNRYDTVMRKGRDLIDSLKEKQAEKKLKKEIREDKIREGKVILAREVAKKREKQNRKDIEMMNQTKAENRMIEENKQSRINKKLRDNLMEFDLKKREGDGRRRKPTLKHIIKNITDILKK
jgi:hypothetical protein